MAVEGWPKTTVVAPCKLLRGEGEHNDPGGDQTNRDSHFVLLNALVEVASFS